MQCDVLWLPHTSRFPAVRFYRFKSLNLRFSDVIEVSKGQWTVNDVIGRFCSILAWSASVHSYGSSAQWCSWSHELRDAFSIGSSMVSLTWTGSCHLGVLTDGLVVCFGLKRCFFAMETFYFRVSISLPWWWDLFQCKVVFAIQMAGPSIGFLFGLSIANSDQLILLMFIEAGFALAVVLAWGLFIPQKPKVAPSLSQQLRSLPTERTSVPLRRWATCIQTYSNSFVSCGEFFLERTSSWGSCMLLF